MSLLELLTVMRRRRLTIAATAFMVVAAVALLTWSTEPTYTATARIYLSTEKPQEPVEPTDNIYLISTSDLQTYIEVMGSPLLRESITSTHRSGCRDALRRVGHHHGEHVHSRHHCYRGESGGGSQGRQRGRPTAGCGC